MKSSKLKNNPKKSKFLTKKLVILLGVLIAVLVILFWQQYTPVEPTMPVEDTIEEPKTEEKVQEEIKEETPKVEEPKLEEPQEEPSTPGECTLGFKCLDENRIGYQSSNCVFSQVIQCDYGCKAGECQPAPPEGETEETFSLTQGELTLNKTGWRYSDFSKDELFQEDINDYDFKMKLYSTSLGNNYFRVESYSSNLGIIEKGIARATRGDCAENTLSANAYGNLRTAQTLCLETKEKDLVLVGAYWEDAPKEDTILTWKYYVLP